MRSGTVAFLLGVCGLVQLSELPDSWYCQLLPFVLLVALWSRRWRLASLIVAGFLWTLWRGYLAMSGYLPVALEGHDLLVEGYVASIPVERRYSRRFVFVVDRRSGEPGWTGRVRLSWYHPTVELSPGQRWQLTVRLKRPRGFMNPGGFDYEGWLFQQQIGATGYVRVSDQSRLLDDSSGQFVPRVRARILGFIDTVLQGHEQRGTVSALAIGYRHSISPGQWTVLRNTGTNHLMAISGLHIGLVAGGGFFCVLWLWSCIPGACLVFAAPRAAAIAAMLAAVFYAGLADFSIPTQRALVMITLVMLNIIAGRRSAPTSVLAAAALGVLVIDPFSVLAPGFWLSFAAVAVILLAVCGRSAFASTGWEKLVVALGKTPDHRCRGVGAVDPGVFLSNFRDRTSGECGGGSLGGVGGCSAYPRRYRSDAGIQRYKRSFSDHGGRGVRDFVVGVGVPRGARSHRGHRTRNKSMGGHWSSDFDRSVARAAWGAWPMVGDLCPAPVVSSPLPDTRSG